MKNVCMAQALAMLVLLIGCSAYVPPPEVEGIEISTIVQEIKAALVEAQEELQDVGLAQLDSVVLTLQTAQEAGSSGSAGLLVLSGTLGSGFSDSQTITLTLKPPQPGEDLEVSASQLRRALVEAIVSASRAGFEANQAGAPELSLVRSDVVLSFSVSKKASTGLKFEILGISLGGAVSSSSKISHTIKLGFLADG